MKSEAKQADEPDSENIEDIIEKPVAELRALLRCKPERKRTLVAVADIDGGDEEMQLLHELLGLEDFKKILEKELCRINEVSYQFEESRKADIITQGTYSEQGSRALVLFASVFVTCRLRNSSPLLYIRDFINMRGQGEDLSKLPQIPSLVAA